MTIYGSYYRNNHPACIVFFVSKHQSPFVVASQSHVDSNPLKILTKQYGFFGIEQTGQPRMNLLPSE